MAYVQPDTIIKLCRGVKNDPRYENTIYFDDASAQYTYFNGKAAYTFSNQSYQRKERGKIRVQTGYDNVYDCNYLMYQNSAFNDKWFYAFINSVEYINNNVVEIDFEIDVLQTWLFEFSMGSCFIERQHTRTDAIGEHLLPEDIAVTDWKYGTEITCDPFDPSISTDNLPKVVFALTEDANAMTGGNMNYPSIKYSGSGIYNGLYLYGFDVPYQGITPDPDPNVFLNHIVAANKASGIVSVFMCPGGFAPVMKINPITGYPYLPQNIPYNNPFHWEVTKETSWTYSYQNKQGPRNKKLYTFQFNKLIITDHDEANAEYAFERFQGTYCDFYVYASICPTPEFSCIPYNYKSAQGAGDSYIHQLTSHGYPQCSWSSDAYQEWVAQNKYKLVLGVGESVSLAGASAALSAVTANPVAAAGSAISPIGKISNALGTMLTLKTLPPQLHGSVGQNVNISSRAIGFHCIHARAIDECLAAADDYFDLFGYKVCRHGMPATNNRKGWTYTKTVGAICLPTQASGRLRSVPADDARKIEQIFDNGVRWWVNGDNIGNYSIDNSPW